MSSPPDLSAPQTAERKAAAWGRPFARLDSGWTRFESLLCAGVLIAETLALCLWIALKGLSTPTADGNSAGLVFRAVIGATFLGLIGFLATRKRAVGMQRAAVLGSITLGLLLGPVWRDVGVEYFSNVLNWCQDASTLTLLGGLRGVGTRLTIWLALLGASLATASGKHINIDVIMRFLKPRARVPVAITGWIAAAAVCFASVWGFFDHIAIESFGVGADDPAGQKISQVVRKTNEHRFLAFRQMGLDLRTLPHVLKGERYDSWLKGAEWNEWIRGGGWDAHYSEDELSMILLPESAADEIHTPLVVIPNGTNRGVLAHDLFLVFPFGMLMIGLRFLLRGVLAASGHVKVVSETEGDSPPSDEGATATEQEALS